MLITGDFDAWRAALTDADWAPGAAKLLAEFADVVPTEGDDVFEGTSADETVNLLGGNDTWDEPFRDSGNDRIFGGRGNDTIDLGDGDDFCKGGGGADTIQAGYGNDRVFGGGGADVISAFGGNNVLNGGAGNDRVSGTGSEGGNDRLSGGAGDDNLSGREGRDKLNGGNGDDTLFLGDEDQDRDRIIFDHRDGTDRVYQFEVGIDQIVITGDRINRFRQVDIAEDSLGRAVVSFGQTEFTLVDVAPEEIGRDDFIFV